MGEWLEYERAAERRGWWERRSEGLDWVIVLAVSWGLVVGAAGLGVGLYVAIERWM